MAITTELSIEGIIRRHWDNQDTALAGYWQKKPIMGNSWRVINTPKPYSPTGVCLFESWMDIYVVDPMDYRSNVDWTWLAWNAVPSRENHIPRIKKDEFDFPLIERQPYEGWLLFQSSSGENLLLVRKDGSYISEPNEGLVGILAENPDANIEEKKSTKKEERRCNVLLETPNGDIATVTEKGVLVKHVNGAYYWVFTTDTGLRIQKEENNQIKPILTHSEMGETNFIDVG